jgi:F-type H+-transporting ATPase subunit epsilon
VTFHAALVIPDRELWSGEASMVIAKTTEGDIGVLTGHSPMFGVLSEASVVRIVTEGDAEVRAAVSGGFLSVADDRISVLAAQAQLGEEVDVEQARQELATALAEGQAGAEDSPAVKYARARLRAASSQD